jgi:hypothetical protein
MSSFMYAKQEHKILIKLVSWLHNCTPTGLVNEVILDKIWVKYWEYKS